MPTQVPDHLRHIRFEETIERVLIDADTIQARVTRNGATNRRNLSRAGSPVDLRA